MDSVELREQLDEAIRYRDTVKAWYDQASNDYHAHVIRVRELEDSVREAEEEYKDPEFKFGDVVGSRNLADGRRWIVLSTNAARLDPFELISGFEFINGPDGPSGSGQWSRDELPDELYVFERLSKTTLPKHRGHDGRPLINSVNL